MKELQVILASQNRISNSGGSSVLATVVDVKGSSYRLPGAKMLISNAGESFGTVSGGCLEADVLERARRVLETGEAQIFVYDTTNVEDSVFSLNMGCHGVIRILLERAEKQLFDFWQNCFAERTSGVTATLIAGDGKTGTRLLLNQNGVVANGFTADAEQKAQIVSGAGNALAAKKSQLQVYDFGEIFFEFVAPPLDLLVFGAGADAIPLVELGKNLGWSVSVVDHRAAFATPERFPNADQISVARIEIFAEKLMIDGNTAAVLMTHNYERDREILRYLLKSPARYVGALGPKRRTESILQELNEAGAKFTETELQKLFAPVGLDIGADAPETIALSIVAEIQSVLAGRGGGFLRNRQGSIYNR